MSLSTTPVRQPLYAPPPTTPEVHRLHAESAQLQSENEFLERRWRTANRVLTAPPQSPTPVPRSQAANDVTPSSAFGDGSSFMPALPRDTTSMSDEDLANAILNSSDVQAVIRQMRVDHERQLHNAVGRRSSSTSRHSPEAFTMSYQPGVVDGRLYSPSTDNRQRNSVASRGGQPQAPLASGAEKVRAIPLPDMTPPRAPRQPASNQYSPAGSHNVTEDEALDGMEVAAAIENLSDALHHHPDADHQTPTNVADIEESVNITAASVNSTMSRMRQRKREHAQHLKNYEMLAAGISPVRPTKNSQYELSKQYDLHREEDEEAEALRDKDVNTTPSRHSAGGKTPRQHTEPGSSDRTPRSGRRSGRGSRSEDEGGHRTPEAQKVRVPFGSVMEEGDAFEPPADEREVANGSKKSSKRKDASPKKSKKDETPKRHSSKPNGDRDNRPRSQPKPKYLDESSFSSASEGSYDTYTYDSDYEEPPTPPPPRAKKGKRVTVVTASKPAASVGAGMRQAARPQQQPQRQQPQSQPQRMGQRGVNTGGAAGGGSVPRSGNARIDAMLNAPLPTPQYRDPFGVPAAPLVRQAPQPAPPFGAMPMGAGVGMGFGSHTPHAVPHHNAPHPTGTLRPIGSVTPPPSVSGGVRSGTPNGMRLYPYNPQQQQQQQQPPQQGGSAVPPPPPSRPPPQKVGARRCC